MADILCGYTADRDETLIAYLYGEIDRHAADVRGRTSPPATAAGTNWPSCRACACRLQEWPAPELAHPFVRLPADAAIRRPAPPIARAAANGGSGPAAAAVCPSGPRRRRRCYSWASRPACEPRRPLRPERSQHPYRVVAPAGALGLGAAAGCRGGRGSGVACRSDGLDASFEPNSAGEPAAPAREAHASRGRRAAAAACSRAGRGQRTQAAERAGAADRRAGERVGSQAEDRSEEHRLEPAGDAEGHRLQDGGGQKQMRAYIDNPATIMSRTQQR